MERTTCCVVGGDPAGMVLGLLLARACVAVTALEKHGTAAFCATSAATQCIPRSWRCCTTSVWPSASPVCSNVG